MFVNYFISESIVYEPIRVEVKVKRREKGDAEFFKRRETRNGNNCTSFTESVQQGLLYER